MQCDVSQKIFFYFYRILLYNRITPLDASKEESQPNLTIQSVKAYSRYMRAVREKTVNITLPLNCIEKKLINALKERKKRGCHVRFD